MNANLSHNRHLILATIVGFTRRLLTFLAWIIVPEQISPNSPEFGVPNKPDKTGRFSDTLLQTFQPQQLRLRSVFYLSSESRVFAYLAAH